MKKTGLLAMAVLLAGCVSQGSSPEQGPGVTRYLCNKAASGVDAQEGQNASAEQTYSCTEEEFEAMNKVYGSMEELKKSL